MQTGRTRIGGVDRHVMFLYISQLQIYQRALYMVTILYLQFNSSATRPEYNQLANCLVWHALLYSGPSRDQMSHAWCGAAIDRIGGLLSISRLAQIVWSTRVVR